MIISSWNFLLHMLRRWGFSDKWQQWMYTCFFTVRLVVLMIFHVVGSVGLLNVTYIAINFCNRLWCLVH